LTLLVSDTKDIWPVENLGHLSPKILFWNMENGDELTEIQL